MKALNKTARLSRVLKKKTRLILGLMSGMSMDGIDLALTSISGEFPNLKIKLVDSSTIPFTSELKSSILAAQSGTTFEVSALHTLLGERFAFEVIQFLEQRNIDPGTVDAIGSHGQTIAHESSPNAQLRHTLQIGSGAIVAEKTGIITVSNFRQRDISAGGAGAPLVPLVDYLLFRKKGQTQVLNNLGSISNATVVTESLDDLFAFDLGPANMPIDFFAKQIPGNISGIDLNGDCARKGVIIPGMLQELLSIPFLKEPPPKAAGFQEFGPLVMEQMQLKHGGHSVRDYLRTVSEFTARSTANAYKDFILPKFPDIKTITFTGGGAKNTFLMELFGEQLPNLKILSLSKEDEKLNDAKEALSFAVLANELLSGRPGNVPSVTGAKTPCMLGDISI